MSSTRETDWAEWRERAGVQPLAQAPAGMIEVSADSFFQLLDSAGGLDPTPNPEKYHTVWTTRNRALWGWSAPGYVDGGLPDPRRVYAVAQR
jgi:hypothetical protein